MARKRWKSKEDKFSHVLQDVESLIDSPLNAIAMALWDLLNNTVELSKKEVVGYVSALVKRLPIKFNDRFHIDGYLIHSITNNWSQGPLKCSGMIVPTYYEKWGYEVIPIPIISGPTHDLHLVYIHREDSNDLPWLLDYPWLVHELGHYLLYAHGQKLIEKYNPYLEKLASSLGARSIADRGLAKTRAEKNLKILKSYWELSPQKRSWTKEIAIDTIALWSCGPAYLAAFEDAHENNSDPFYLDQTHPPVELRVYALVKAAHRLGWKDQVEALEVLLERWRQPGTPQPSTNQYNSLRREELIDGCLEATLGYCQFLQLPCLKQADIERVRQAIDHGEDLSDAIDLIVGAWLVYQEQGSVIYAEWETRTMDTLVEWVTQ